MAILEEGEAKGLERGLSQGLSQGLEKGRLEGEVLGLREAIEDLGTAQFGSPSRENLAELAGITDAHRLRRMLRQLRAAADWNSLLETT